MKKTSKKKLIIILYIILVLLPILYTFAFIARFTPGKIELALEEELSDIFDMPVEMSGLKVIGAGSYEINQLRFKTSPGAEPFLIASDAHFSSEGDGAVHRFRIGSCKADVTDSEDFKIISGSLERIIKKQQAGKFPDIEMKCNRAEISFSVKGRPISAFDAKADFAITSQNQGTFSFSGSVPQSGVPVSAVGVLTWDARSIEISSPELPFPAAAFVKKVFGPRPEVPATFDGVMKRAISSGEDTLTIAGKLQIDASKYFTQKFIGRARGSLKVRINSWNVRDGSDDLDIILSHQSTPGSILVVSDHGLLKAAYLLTGAVPAGPLAQDVSMPEELGLQIMVRGGDIKFRGSVDFSSTWIMLPGASFKVESSLTREELKRRFAKIQGGGLPVPEAPNPAKHVWDFIFGD